jgi:hypothetical protein
MNRFVRFANGFFVGSGHEAELGIVLDKTVRMKAKGAEAELINELLAAQYELLRRSREAARPSEAAKPRPPRR